MNKEPEKFQVKLGFYYKAAY